MKRSVAWMVSVVWLFAICSCVPNKVKFKSFAPRPEKGYPIYGLVSKPEGNGPFPGILLLHRCYGIQDIDYEWAGRFNKWGYATMIVDSHGPRNIMGQCEKRIVGYLERAMDAHAAKVAFGQLPYVDRNRIGVIGASEGGGTVLQLVNETVIGGYVPENAQDPFKAAVALYPYCYGTIKSASNLLILIGEKDEWTPAGNCRGSLPKPASPDIEVAIKVYPGAYHRFDVLHSGTSHNGHPLEYSPSAMKDAVPRIKAFYDKYVKGTEDEQR